VESFGEWLLHHRGAAESTRYTYAQGANGRLSRILTTLLLLRAGYGQIPYSSLESLIEASQDACYLALRQTQPTGGRSERRPEILGYRFFACPPWSHAAPLLLGSGEGLVVNTSSFGERFYMHGPAYGAGKAGVDKMAHVALVCVPRTTRSQRQCSR